MATISTLLISSLQSVLVRILFMAAFTLGGAGSLQRSPDSWLYFRGRFMAGREGEDRGGERRERVEGKGRESTGGDTPKNKILCESLDML